MARYKRRQLFVHPLQYWSLATALIYFSCMLMVLYGVVFLPMVESLDSPDTTWQEQAQAASQFLDFNARVWPWVFVTFLSLLLHSIYLMHRIAGPLYRFTTLFQAIGAGSWHMRATLREHDYLHREAQDFNSMLDRLEQKIGSLNLHCAAVTVAYEDVALLVRGESPDHAQAVLAKLEEEIQQLKSSLAEFKRPPLPSPHGQQEIERAAQGPMGPPTSKKAA